MFFYWSILKYKDRTDKQKTTCYPARHVPLVTTIRDIGCPGSGHCYFLGQIKV